MQRPLPGVFHGTVPEDCVSDLKLVADIERVMGVSALLLAFSAWGLTLGLSSQVSWFAMRVGCVVLLAVSLVGLWLKRRAALTPQSETAAIYQAVLRRMSLGGAAIPNVSALGGYAGVTGLIEELASSLTKTQAGRAKLEAALAGTESHLQRGRQEAQRIGRQITHEADSLSQAASRVSAADLRISGEAEKTGRSLDIADNAVARAIDGMATIVASVRATTSGAQQMTAAAVQMADVAHNTHRRIADLDDQTAKAVVALDYVERAMQVAAALGQAGCIEATEQGASAATFARLALELQEVAGGCQPALADAGEALRELITQTAEANRRTLEILELVNANHDVGRAVSHAVQEQGDEIARVLTELYEARPGFATLRAGVEAVTQACATRTEAADTIRKTANALPSHAEDLANVLRGLPSLARNEDY